MGAKKYYVAKRHAVSCINGVLGEGEEISWKNMQGKDEEEKKKQFEALAKSTMITTKKPSSESEEKEAEKEQEIPEVLENEKSSESPDGEGAKKKK